MADNARGIHVSPGVYSREIELTYAAKSLGITTLGLVGETVKGPAFQPMLISNWREFENMFGGTNPEKFKGSQYPKYELPYIAKSYLTQSQQLEVCRVLGLSGFNAGPAWAITANLKTSIKDDNDKMVVAIIRARGEYKKYFKYENDTTSTGTCECELQSYDTLVYKVGEKAIRSCYKPTDYNLSALQIGEYIPLESTGNECVGYGNNGGAGEWAISMSNYGRFKLYGWSGRHDFEEMKTWIGNGDATKAGKSQSDYFEYPVTLNPNDKDYILKVLGSSADEGEAPIYVESLYDVALLQELAKDNVTAITSSLTPYQVYYTSDHDGVEPIYDFMYLQEEQLARKNLGQRFIANAANVKENYHCHLYDYKTGKPVIGGVTIMPNAENGKSETDTWSADSGITYLDDKKTQEKPQTVTIGQIYTVAQYTDASGKRHYYYRYYSKDDNYIKYLANVKNTNIIPIIDKLGTEEEMTASTASAMTSGFNGQYASDARTLVKNNADDLYYRIKTENAVSDVEVVKIDLNNYKSPYRYASTPWIVSNVKGDYQHLEVNKLFRFHTISDGTMSNYQVKVSIANIKPDDGTFDVIIRNINDSDSNIDGLEKFSKCSLVPGTSNYLGLKIGTYDGSYESKSNYVTVEINENATTQNSVPAGFLGYPIHDFGGVQISDKAKYSISGNSEDKVDYSKIIGPIIQYNQSYDEDLKNRRQYFGLSDITGVDIDLFTYKGNSSYVDSPEYISQGFHLDSRLDLNGYTNSDEMPLITVDNVSGYEFDAVSVNSRTALLTEMPIIGKEIEMDGSIYEYVDLRKFTVYFYGGFDGWDVFRQQRSNTDDFKKSKYRGQYSDISGEGCAFDRISDAESLGLNQDGITSDWYAYLSAIRQFSNPQSVDINVFATPGIDYVNNKLLVDETIDMIEQERADSIYVVTTPDKPMGAGDYQSEMYTPDDAVYNLEDTEIDSNYTCTYYPWIKYYDKTNNQYIMLPATKDVVRNMAQTDNTSFPWFAPAGFNRGDVECVKAHYITKLSDEDTLYEGRINPIKSFSSDGVKIWGQKNLQIAEGQLNRIAVRRLLLRIRKLIAVACNRLIFEPNDATTKNKFLSLVTPIMDNVKSNRGISDYRIEVDDSVEARERRELPAKLFLKPINALEYITLDFIITPESVSFDDI